MLIPALPVPAPSASAPASPTAVRQVAVFLVVGAVTTAAYAALVALVAPHTGLQAANALALVLTAAANTGANRRWGFGLRGRDEVVRHQVQGLLALLLTLALTSGAIAASGTTEATREGLLVLVLANVLAGAVHFLLLQRWVFVTRD